MPRQLFELAIQAAVGTKVVARETLSAMRKDVTAGLYGGHYERKLKHLNKQKEGKKRLKKLAGNIDIPQTAFFNVLSQRPRTYTTSAQTSHGATEDAWLHEIVPSPPTTLSELAEGTPLSDGQPLGRPTMAPENRSDILGTIYRQVAQKPRGQSSERLFGDFTRLYLSSPAPLFSVPELQSIAKAVHSLDRRSTRRHRRQAHERFETVVNALRDVVGDHKHVPSGLEVSMLVSSTNHRRHVTRGELKKAEQQFLSSFQSAPSDPARREQYLRGLNHILYLSALARHPERTEFWWNKMIGEGFEPDSWSYLSRIMTYGSMYNRTEALVSELERALPKVRSREDKVVLANVAMWLAAVAKRMDVAGAIFSTINPPNETTTYSHAIAELPIGVIEELCELTPSRETFYLMLSEYAYHGDLISALTTMKQMLAAGHSLVVANYVSLFRGFAKFGQILEGPAGEASELFPPLIEFKSLGSAFEAKQRRTESAASTARGFFDSLRGPRRQFEADILNHWTLSAFEDVFRGFLALTSSKEWVSSAPTPKGIHFALLAWARVTNGDAVAVWHAYHDIRTKFGPGNKEGWVGWEEDTRLRNLRDRLEEMVKGKSSTSHQHHQ